MSKKKNGFPFLGLIFVLLTLSLILYFGFFFKMPTGTLIPDGMNYYDDFNSGLRTDLWKISGDSSLVSVQNGVMYINEEIPCKGTTREASVTSNKLFFGDSIKVNMVAIVNGVSCGNYATPPAYSPKLFFGNQEIPMFSGVTGQRIDYYKGHYETLKYNLVIEIKPYDDLDLSKYVVLVNGQEVYNGVLANPSSLIFAGGNMQINEVKYLPYFSCEIDKNTEVQVRDTFSAGSTFNKDDLTYEPTKYCKDDLGIIRLSDSGLTREVGSLTDRLANGESLTVPVGETWYSRYITKYVTDMKERCDPINEEYSTQLKKCISTGVQQEINNNELLYCNADSDCIVPDKCNDATVRCVSNKCDYKSTVCTPEQIINYVEVIKTLEIEKPQYIVIPESQNEITFTSKAGLSVAGKSWQISNLKALTSLSECQVARGEYLSPSKKGCYQVRATWGNYDFEIKNGETKKLDDHVTVTYELSGRGAFNGVKNYIDYNYEFINYPDNIFKVNFTNIFDIKVDSYKEKTTLNSDNKIKLSITNNLFDLDGGYTLKVIKNIIPVELPTQRLPISYKSGTNTIEFNSPTDTTGTYTIIFTPYFNMLDNKDYFSPKSLSLGYYVSTENLDCDSTKCLIGECKSDGNCYVTEKDTEVVIKKEAVTPTFIWYILGALVLVIIIMIVYFVVRKGKR